MTTSLQLINVGTSPNDHTGDALRTGGQKINNNFTIRSAAEISAGVIPVAYEYEPGDVRRYGAVGDGVNDDTAAILLAISCNSVTTLPVGKFLVSSTIAVPAGKAMFGAGLISASDAGQNVGTAFIASSLSLTPVVKLGSQTLVGESLKGFSVFRTTGTPVAGTIGVLVHGGQVPILEDVYSSSHDIPWYFQGDQTGGAGNTIGFMLTRIYSGAAYDAHIVVDTVPELRFSQCRFGSNGVGDQNCNTYLRITGGNAAHPPAGPNSTMFDNCQFNQGGVATHHWVEFTNLTSPGLPTIDARVFYFDNCHIEGVDTAHIYVDSTWKSIDRLGITNCTFNNPSTPFWDVPATLIFNQMRFAANWIAASTFAPNINTVNSWSMVGNSFTSCAVTYNAGTAWTLTSLGNVYDSGSSLTLSGSGWQQAIIGDVLNSGLTFTNSATPVTAVALISPMQGVSWTPGIAFGGTDSNTYSRQVGKYQIVNNLVFAEMSIIMTAKGGSSGSATITGLPIPSNSAVFSAGNCSLIAVTNFSGLTGAPLIAVGQNSTTISFHQTSATGNPVLTDTSFTNTSTVNASIWYAA